MQNLKNIVMRLASVTKNDLSRAVVVANLLEGLLSIPKGSNPVIGKIL